MKNLLKSDIFEKVLDLSGVAFRVISIDKKVYKANKLFAEIAQQSLSNIVNRNCCDSFNTENCNTEKCSLQQIINGEENVEIEIKVDSDDEDKWFIFKALPIKDEAGAILGIVESFKDITNVKRKEENSLKRSKILQQLIEVRNRELQMSETMLQNIFENYSEYIVLWLPSGKIIYSNQYYKDFINEYFHISVLKENFCAIISPDNTQEVMDNIMQLSAENNYYQHEVVLLINGEEIWQEWKHKALFNNDFKLIEIQSIGRDITQQKITDKKLKESENYFKLLFDLSPDAAILASENTGNILKANHQACVMFGYNNEEFLNLNQINLHPNNKAQRYRDLFRYALGKKDQVSLRFDNLQGKRKDGTTFPLEIYSVSFELEGERVIQGNFRDLTARKDLEINLVETRNRYETLWENSGTINSFFNTKGVMLFQNEASAKQLGGTKQMFKGKHAIELFGKERGGEVMERISKVVETLKSYEHITNFTLKTGEKWFKSIYLPIISDKKKIDGVQVISQEVTDIFLAENKIRESEIKFRNIFESTINGILITSFEGEVLEVNKVSEEYFSRNREDIINTSIFQLFEVELKNKIAQYLNDLIEDTEAKVQIEVSSKSKVLFLEVNGKLIDYEGGKAILHILIDQTEKRQFQNRLFSTILETEEKQKERFSKDLHDGLGPILSTIKIYIQTLQDENPTESQKEIIERVFKLTNQALSGIKEISNNLSPYILRYHGLFSAINFLVNNIKEPQKIAFTLDIPECRFPENIEMAIYRIVSELLTNTIKYAGATKVEIEVKPKKNKVLVKYFDDGKGFDVKKALKKVKSMGLHNIQSRIEALNGFVTIDSKPGKGMKTEIEIKINEKNK